MAATKEHRTRKSYWNGLVSQLERQKDRTKARESEKTWITQISFLEVQA